MLQIHQLSPKFLAEVIEPVQWCCIVSCTLSSLLIRMVNVYSLSFSPCSLHCTLAVTKSLFTLDRYVAQDMWLCIYFTEILSQGLGKRGCEWHLPVGGHWSGVKREGLLPKKHLRRKSLSEKHIPQLWPNHLHCHLSILLKSSPLIVRDTTGLPWKRNSRKSLQMGLWTCCHFCDVFIGKAWKSVCLVFLRKVVFFLFFMTEAIGQDNSSEIIGSH